ncbi:hypothetical protein FRC12_005639 [Ceratobasidium sp. 428]|nr:hypothetical protein FRC12_005639 [Ceratobasidium sp. 428]
MSQYRYEAASTSQSSGTGSSRQATSQSSSASRTRTHYTKAPSVSTAAEQNSAYTTRDRWTTVQSSPIEPAEVQSPTVRMRGGSRSPRSVRFFDEPALAHAQPCGSQRRADSPASQGSAPSLVHSVGEHDDNLECPPTPELKPAELAPKRSCLKIRTLAHEASLSTIAQIVFELGECVVDFEHPRDLDFRTPDPISGAPRLAFTAKNKPLLEHIQKLEKLQDELDDIESYDDALIRKTRKAAGSQVQQELDGLARIQVRFWHKTQRSSAQHDSHRR